MKYFTPIIFFLSFGVHAFVPKSTHEPAQADENAIYIDTLLEQSYRLLSQNLDSSYAMSLEALALSVEYGFQVRTITSHLRIGSVHKARKINDSAIFHFQKAYSISQQANNLNRQAASLLGIAQIHLKTPNIDSAKRYYYRVIDILDRDSLEFENLFTAYKGLALTYNKNGQYDSALIYFNRSLELAKNHDLRLQQASVLHNRALTHIHLGEYEEAIEDLRKASRVYQRRNRTLSIANSFTVLAQAYGKLQYFDSAIYFADSARILVETHNPEGLDPQLISNLGLYHALDGNIPAGKEFLILADSLAKAQGNLEAQVTTQHNFVIIHLQENEAAQAFERLISMTPLVDSLDIAQITNYHYNQLALVATTMGDFQAALEYTGIAQAQILDLLKYKNRAYQIQLELERSENENKTTELQLQKALKNVYLYGGITITLVLFLFALVLLGRIRRKKQALKLQSAEVESQAFQLALKEKEIELQKEKVIGHQREIDKILKEQELAALNAMVEGQETERQRIARDLHDRLGSILSTVKLHFSTISQALASLQDQVKDQYQEANKLLDTAHEEVRQIAHDMVSGVLVEFGLLATLRKLGQSIESTGKLQVEVHDFGMEERLDQLLEIPLYRIIQELIGNVLKHAQATELTIQLIRKDRNLQVLVEDNGIGFDQSQLTEQQGMGLKNLALRVEDLNGTFDIDTTPNTGTTVTINIPI